MSFKKRLTIHGTLITVVSLISLLCVAGFIMKIYISHHFEIFNSQLDINTAKVYEIIKGIDTNDKSFSEEIKNLDFEFIIVDDGNRLDINVKNGLHKIISNLLNRVWTNETEILFYEGITIVGKKIDDSMILAISISNFSSLRNESFQKMLLNFVIACSLVVIVIIIISTLFSRHFVKKLTRPLDELVEGAKRIKDGDLTKELNTSYDDEFKNVCETFNDMQFHLKNEQEKNIMYERARQEMINGISHDLRTPLTSVKGYIKGIKDGVATTDTKKIEYLDIAYFKSIEIENLLSNFFDSFNIKNGNVKLKLEKKSVKKYLDEYLKLKNKELINKNITIKINTPSVDYFAFIDKNQMNRVFSNLIDNSIKYADTKKLYIDINIWKANGKIHISYSDNGVGIKDNDTSRLFDEFYRGDSSRNSKIKGQGLGLFIVKSVINSHKGEVIIKNHKGFYIEIILEEVGD